MAKIILFCLINFLNFIFMKLTTILKLILILSGMIIVGLFELYIISPFNWVELINQVNNH